jgi:hypothetical protein
MNLEGATVEFFVSEENIHSMNNGSTSCPAIVCRDWSPESENEYKVLNLRIIYDGAQIGYETSVPHVDAENKSSAWGFYPK